MPEGFRYRYDGLYRVARYWQEAGQDRFKIWRFRIEEALISDYAPRPEDTDQAKQRESIVLQLVQLLDSLSPFLHVRSLSRYSTVYKKL
jgi:hypothetical protein